MTILADYPPAAPRAAAWFLFVSYAVGGPAFAAVEAVSHLMSERFGYWPEFLYAVFLMQFVCSLMMLKRRLAIPALMMLTLISLGAMASHFRIHSPLTSLPALGYTAVQVWLALRIRRGESR
ncbi:MAG: hypothetical protein RIC56_11815 [Pseudomonadales bacterium]